MKKYTIIALVVLGIMLVSGSIQAQVISSATDDNAQDAVAAVIENVSTDADQDTNAAVVLPPVITPNTGSDVDQDTVVADVTSNVGTDADQDVSNTIVSNTSSDTDQDAGQVTPPTTPSDSNTGSNGGSSGSRGGGSNSSRSSSVAVTTTASITPCPLITTFMKINGTNDRADVSRLQIFLSNTEKLALDITGTFDAKTESAVKSFQKKYQNDILTPWGATLPSGNVYITTSKKINEIACAKPIQISASEQAIINAYKARVNSSTPVSVTDTETVTPAVQDETTTPVTNDEIGTTESPTTDNTAAVGNTSIFSRFWNFVTGLFN
jgi:hypothetical protein